MPKAYRYGGILGKAKPRTATQRLAPVLPDDAALQEAARAELDSEYEALWAELFKECGASWPPWDHPGEHGWMKVATALARRHVPGFGSKSSLRSRGRPPKGRIDDLEVATQVAEQMKSRGLSARSASANVARSRKRGETAAAIESRYRRIKKLVRLFFSG